MAAFDPVKERAARILIVASGPSAGMLDLNLVKSLKESAGIYCIAVNRSWLWFHHADAWFTLDPNKLLWQFIAQQDTGVRRFVAVPDDYGQPYAKVQYHRNSPFLPGIHYLHRKSGPLPLGGMPGLSTAANTIHTGNSAYGALGLAFHMKPERIAMVGVDARRVLGYAYVPGRPGELAHLPALFATAAGQLNEAGIQVVNGSPFSMVECFPAMAPNKALLWLAGA